MVRFRVRHVLCLALAVTAVGSAGATASNPVAQKAGTCSVGNGRGYGYSYLTYLWVYRTSCSTGRSLAHKHGRAHGWRCSRRILDRSPVQYDARMTCHSGSRQVQWTYTQNT